MKLGTFIALYRRLHWLHVATVLFCLTAQFWFSAYNEGRVAYMEEKYERLSRMSLKELGKLKVSHEG